MVLVKFEMKRLKKRIITAEVEKFRRSFDWELNDCANVHLNGMIANMIFIVCFHVGLVVYDDSDASKSDDDSDSDGDRNNDQNASDIDSDAELKVSFFHLPNKMNWKKLKLLLSHTQRAIQRRKLAFESKSEEIESYLAELEEREKQWLENDDSAKVDESKSQATAPIANHPLKNKSDETDGIQRDAPKMPNGTHFSFICNSVFF